MKYFYLLGLLVLPPLVRLIQTIVPRRMMIVEGQTLAAAAVQPWIDTLPPYRLLRFYTAYAGLLIICTLIKSDQTPFALDFAANRLEHLLLIAMCCVLAYAWLKPEGDGSRPRHFLARCLILAMVVGLGIEVVQAFSRVEYLRIHPVKGAYFYLDSLLDLLADAGGAFLASWLLWRKSDAHVQN